MSVQSVQCCQCGSPLPLPDVDDGYLRCQHCSALLEVEQLEHGQVTHLRADIRELQKATAAHERSLRKLQLERDLADLDRRWRERWGKQADDPAEAMSGDVLFSWSVLGILGGIALIGGWSDRAARTRPWHSLGWSVAFALLLVGIGYFIHFGTKLRWEEWEEYQARRLALIRRAYSERDES